MFRDLKDGFLSYFDALGLIGKYNLWKYTLWAGLVSLLIVALGGFSSYAFSDDLASLITGWISFIPENSIFTKIAEWLSGIMIFLVFLVIYKYIVLIVMSPFMSPLSEELENRLNEDYEPVPFSVSLALKDLWRGLRINIRNLFRELGYTLLLFLASLIPGAAVITAPLIFIVQSYYAGFGNMDYYLERHLNVTESSKFVNDFKGLAIGNGIVFMLILMIPIVGLFLAPTLATAAATQECEKRYSIAHS